MVGQDFFRNRSRFGETQALPERGNDYLEADIEFHFAVARAAHNPLLSQYLTLTRNIIHKWFHSQNSFYSPGLQQGLGEHREIFGAIRGGMPTEARQAMRRHLIAAANRLLTAMKTGEERRREER